MHTELQKTFLIFLLFLLITAPVSAFSSEVVSISITSSHSGVAGFSGKSNFIIQKTPEGYQGKLGIVDITYNFETLIKEGLYIENKDSSYKEKSWSINTKVTNEKEVFRRLYNDYKETSNHSISNIQIEQFIQALNDQPKTRLDFSQLGIDQKWLKDMATKAVDKWLDPTKDYYFLLKSRRSKLIDALSNEDKAFKDLSWYYTESMTYDDYPTLDATITFSDGKIIRLTSESQHEFMIPWKVKRNGQEFATFDIRISKALEMLLPEKFQEKKRIKGNLFRVFEEYFWSSDIHGWLNTAESEFILRGQIDFLTNEFNLVQGNLIYDHKNPDNGEWELIDKGKWLVTLSHKDWPKNVFISSAIPYLSGRIDYENFSSEKIHFYIKKLTEISWLFKYIQKHPDTQFFVDFSNDRSITSLDFNEEMERLRKNQNYEWKAEKYPYHEDIISLSVYNIRGGLRSSHWLIFPDKTTTLYNFRGEQVMNWTKNQLSRWKIGVGHFSGARISPDGKIIHP